MSTMTSSTSTPLLHQRANVLTPLLRKLVKNNIKTPPIRTSISLTIKVYRPSIWIKGTSDIRKSMKGRFTTKIAEYITLSTEGLIRTQETTAEYKTTAQDKVVSKVHKYSATMTLSLENIVPHNNNKNSKAFSYREAEGKEKISNKSCLPPTATSNQYR